MSDDFKTPRPTWPDPVDREGLRKGEDEADALIGEWSARALDAESRLREAEERIVHAEDSLRTVRGLYEELEAECDRLRGALNRIDFNARTECPTDDFGNECGCGEIASQALGGSSE